MPNDQSRTVKRLSEIGIGVLVLLLATLVVVLGTVVLFSYDRSMIEGIAVEAHGMLFDLLVIGVFTLWLNVRLQKAKVNSDYLEQIDDFRTWKSEEASYRIAGIVRRLSRNGHNRIDLYQCCIKSVLLRDICIKDANCWAVNFTDSILKKVEFHKCKMKGAAFNRVRGSGISFVDCYLAIGKFDACKMNGSTFTSSDLRNASFLDSTVRNVSFKGCGLEGVSFDGADLAGANFRGAKGLTIPQLLKAKSIRNIVLDDSLIDALESVRPGQVRRYMDPDGKARSSIRD